MTVTQTTTTITREEHTVSQLIKPMFKEPLEPEIYVRERGIARYIPKSPFICELIFIYTCRYKLV